MREVLKEDSCGTFIENMKEFDVLVRKYGRWSDQKHQNCLEKADQKDLGGEAVSNFFLRGSIDLEGGRIHGLDPVSLPKGIA